MTKSILLIISFSILMLTKTSAQSGWISAKIEHIGVEGNFMDLSNDFLSYKNSDNIQLNKFVSETDLIASLDLELNKLDRHNFEKNDWRDTNNYQLDNRKHLARASKLQALEKRFGSFKPLVHDWILDVTRN